MDDRFLKEIVLKIMPSEAKTNSLLIVNCNKSLESMRFEWRRSSCKDETKVHVGKTYQCSPIDLNHFIELTVIGSTWKKCIQSTPIQICKEHQEYLMKMNNIIKELKEKETFPFKLILESNLFPAKILLRTGYMVIICAFSSQNVCTVPLSSVIFESDPADTNTLKIDIKQKSENLETFIKKLSSSSNSLDKNALICFFPNENQIFNDYSRDALLLIYQEQSVLKQRIRSTSGVPIQASQKSATDKLFSNNFIESNKFDLTSKADIFNKTVEKSKVEFSNKLNFSQKITKIEENQADSKKKPLPFSTKKEILEQNGANKRQEIEKQGHSNLYTNPIFFPISEPINAAYASTNTSINSNLTKIVPSSLTGSANLESHILNIKTSNAIETKKEREYLNIFEDEDEEPTLLSERTKNYHEKNNNKNIIKNIEIVRPKINSVIDKNSLNLMSSFEEFEKNEKEQEQEITFHTTFEEKKRPRDMNKTKPETVELKKELKESREKCVLLENENKNIKKKYLELLESYRIICDEHMKCIQNRSNLSIKKETNLLYTEEKRGPKIEYQ